MPRYIDATKLEELCEIMADKCDGIGESIWNQFRTTVEWCPTADVVEVVRCKDCKYYDADERWCRLLLPRRAFNVNDFCSFGEMKEKESVK